MADNLTTLMCQLFRNLGSSVSWNPQDRPDLLRRIALLCITVRHRGNYAGLIQVIQASIRNSGAKNGNIMRSVSGSGWVK